MKKSIIRKMAVLVMTMLICSSMLGVVAQAANGVVFDEFTEGLGTTYAMPITNPVHVFERWVGVNGSGKVETSDKYVVAVGSKVGYLEVDGIKIACDVITMVPKKVGKSNISAYYTYSDKYGTPHTENVHFTIRTYKWTNPFATLKIGKKNFKKAFKKTDERTIKPVKGKLKIKMNKKYKLSKVLYQANGSDSWKKIGKKSKVKLNHGDKLRFQFKDNKHYVSNATATFTIG